MSFAVGDKVSYPHHGATMIQQVETIEVLGAAPAYLGLRLEYVDLTLRVPPGQGVAVGVHGRSVSNRRRGAPTGNAWARRGKSQVCVFRPEPALGVDHKNLNPRRRFVGDHGKFGSRSDTGTGAQNQQALGRDIATAVKTGRDWRCCLRRAGVGIGPDRLEPRRPAGAQRTAAWDRRPSGQRQPRRRPERTWQ
ncbi:MAG: CarD family transcriptional regulator [Acidimicrobiales bacterium]